ncbi:hypothetical protein [Archangium sp.]|jgi:hypothetical protein|uniref:hypothetical protein n=1 Tax=Archangium sp. TaxID=1872627 RepID=UPI002ED97F48
MPDMTETGEKTSTARTILTILGVTLLLLLVTLAGAYWRLGQRFRKAGDELVSEVHVLASLRRVRPAHTDAPTPGTFAQALGPLMPELLRLHKAEPRLEESITTACRDVREGKQPLAKLPRECRDAFDRGRPLMQRALLASRTEEPGLPEGLPALSDPSHPNQKSGMVALQHVVKLAALEVRFQLQDGQADAALETCLDGLGLARDLGHGSGLIGAMVSASGYKILFPACTDALQRASPLGLKKATVALRRLREGLSPLSSAMREEHVFGPLYAFGRLLDQDQLAALPADGRAIAAQGSLDVGVEIPFFAPVLMRHAMVEFMRLQGQMVPLVDLPLSARAARLGAVGREAVSSRNPLVGLGMPAFDTFAARADRQRAQVDLLLALALVEAYRAERGEWPSTLPPLYPERAVLLPTALKLQPEGTDALRVVPEEADLRELEVVLGSEELDSQALSVTATP